jgi:hypothetical protein
MWPNTPFEFRIASELEAQMGQASGQSLFAHYTNAKHVLPPVWERIIAAEPMLSDHGPRHIQNVLQNVERLIDGQYFSGVELYSLCMMTLFHDVGNIFGRQGHERRIARVYDAVRQGMVPPSQEKYIVVQGAGAHSGTAKDGSKDTLKDLADHHLEGHSVRLPQLAAVLRLADELAEGPQRTSDYMRRTHSYDSGSEIFHRYAEITSIAVDKGNSRVALTYEFNLSSENGSIEHSVGELASLLEFVFRRIQKLDQERKYARFYTDVLAPFKTTSVQLNFWIDGSFQDINIRPLMLTEKVIPGDAAKEIRAIDPEYDIPYLIGKLRACGSEPPRSKNLLSSIRGWFTLRR